MSTALWVGVSVIGLFLVFTFLGAIPWASKSDVTKVEMALKSDIARTETQVNKLETHIGRVDSEQRTQANTVSTLSADVMVMKQRLERIELKIDRLLEGRSPMMGVP